MAWTRTGKRKVRDAFFSALRTICRCVFCLSVCLSFALGGKYTRARALALYCSLMEKKNACMHGPAADVSIRSLKGETRSDVISNVYVLPGARLARPSQFACAQRQRLQDASAEHAYISGLSSSLRGRRKNGVGDNGFSRSVREVYFPSFALVDVRRAWNCCLIWHLVELGAPALMRSLPCWWRVCSDVSRVQFMLGVHTLSEIKVPALKENL